MTSIGPCTRTAAACPCRARSATAPSSITRTPISPTPRSTTSGTPWHTLYYKDNYARLQRIKARWDPRDEFRHALSIRPPK
ncbi:BBE domain-containing protein [Streptomyces chattanoogensis]|uniref:BBE domain-containing protein n=1 Tax=Streptomyces chattanoogensis TaxID=66876 RepID=UPI001FE139FA|nr:BBE domain-containing protein [Streptomyces chattanoogensis]